MAASLPYENFTWKFFQQINIMKIVDGTIAKSPNSAHDLDPKKGGKRLTTLHEEC